ncbi:galactose-1-phosphate uridylyltransferase [Methanoculleus sp. Wushi-C6]|uniref:Galactose-1-phosphate uridylyltransferase n=1 Tax=Methanoculleus caldifontis TaxID=2651577 RepID=A0ABU3X0H3_9EURY|nr:galactose-1-phosphate uridylyltransferase [Methanoculleus sp. Wushi-C6]MDV2481538.1 galactose-1-phosphate uridylyltransferase [Methanoculleus sp. Wushi-C6]
MFTTREIRTERGVLQYRRESLTGLRCRISPARIGRRIDTAPNLPSSRDGCPFCPGAVGSSTPTFADGSRLRWGESVTFPNLYPFAERHVVTVITRDHAPVGFDPRCLADAISGTAEGLARSPGYASINWNCLPSAGASIVHPHLQGIADVEPTLLAGLYLSAGRRYLADHGRPYWDDLIERERCSGRFLFEDEVFWSANPVPLGEREVRGILPVSTLDELEPYIEPLADGICRVIAFYRNLGTYAFNVSIFFDAPGTAGRGHRAFCSIIARLNPNSLSMCDSAFMERLHLEPVILTLPEDLGALFEEKN